MVKPKNTRLRLQPVSAEIGPATQKKQSAEVKYPQTEEIPFVKSHLALQVFDFKEVNEYRKAFKNPGKLNELDQNNSPLFKRRTYGSQFPGMEKFIEQTTLLHMDKKKIKNLKMEQLNSEIRSTLNFPFLENSN